MKALLKVSLVIGALALSATPAFAANPHEGSPPYGKGHGQNGSPGNSGNQTPGPKAGLPAKAKAYGRYCKDESKKHVKGEKGTPFSRCVTAMAKAANHSQMSPGRACKGESKKHVKGEKGTPFSRCVKAAAKLRHDQEGDNSQG